MGEVLNPAKMDPGGSVAILAMLFKTFGKGIAIFFGLFSMFVCWVGKMLVPLLSRQSPSRYGSGGGGLSPVAAVVAFVVGVGIGIAVPAPSVPVVAADGEKKETMVFKPFHSQMFRFHVMLPEKLEKERAIEKESGMNVPVTIVGYIDRKNRKNEMAIGYAKLPSVDEMVTAQQKKNPFQLGMPVNPLGGQVVYYFDVEKGLDGAIKGIKQKGKLNVAYTCPLLLDNKVPGRELEGDAPGDRFVRGRIYIAYGNYYVCLVAGDKQFVNSNNAYKFLDSFGTN